MEIANIVKVYRDIKGRDLVVVREILDEEYGITKLMRVARLMHEPMSGLHLSEISVGGKWDAHYIVLKRTGKEYFSVADCISSTLNIDRGDTIDFINEDTGEVKYLHADDILTGDCDVIGHEVVEVKLGREHHTIYIKKRH